jgi:pimeloyl-ACP methyl ester carboxylesterase
MVYGGIDVRTSMHATSPTDDFDWGRLWRVIGAMPQLRTDAKAFLNGAVGDRLHADGSDLAIQMQLLHDGEVLDLDHELSGTEGLSSRIAIFVPGLMAGPMFWSFVSSSPFPERLAADRGVTSIHVLYNSGLHISVNGRQLAHQIQRLVDAWPVEITEINLIGHSMGGLVTRSAGHYASEASLPWLDKLRRMILLGAPLRGASLEQVANLTAFILNAIPNPWTWAIGWVFQQRSAGIKDLRHGYIVDEEWKSRSPDALSMGRQHLIPLLPNVEHFLAAGSLFEDEHHPLAKVFGDLLVAPFSAKDEGVDGTPSERTPNQTRVFPGVSHPFMAGDDAVYAQILEWWGPSPDPLLLTGPQ